MGERAGHEGVLHVDDDERRLAWRQIVVNMLAAAPLDDALDDFRGYKAVVHKARPFPQTLLRRR